MNDEMVIMCDLTVFNGRFRYLKTAMLLLNVLVNLRAPDNTVNLTREDMLDAISDGTSADYTDKSLKGWLTLLAKNGAIKYRDNATKIMINPHYVFKGSNKEFYNVVMKWETFKSDVDVVQAVFN